MVSFGCAQPQFYRVAIARQLAIVTHPSACIPPSMLTAAGLVDAFRERHPSMRPFTFYAHSGSASRLDYVLCGGPLFAHFPPVNPFFFGAAVAWIMILW